jgi:hypothetical protein
MLVQHFSYIGENFTIYIPELMKLLIFFYAPFNPPQRKKGYLNGTSYKI